ncbi:MAG: T9SS type A sorting domain-containing protein, partial [Fluviicola sp.]
REDELNRNNNSTSFDPYVAKYVDAMMYMTDSIIDSSNYEMQYVLEIDKAHLMRLTGHPEIGLNILTELENCGLDSIAQANLNFWKQEYETDIIIKQIGQQYLDTTISIDTSTYFNPVLAVNNYSFGSIINDVNDIQYTNCDFFNSKELMTGKLENQIAVYPNPATTLFDIAIKSPVEGLGSFKIVQMDGKTICERQFEMSFNHNDKVESANWPSGVYTLIVTLPSKEQKRIKILVQ